MGLDEVVQPSRGMKGLWTTLRDTGKNRMMPSAPYPCHYTNEER